MGVYYTAQENNLFGLYPWSLPSFDSPFTLLVTDTVNLTRDTATGYIAIPQLAIPAGEKPILFGLDHYLAMLVTKWNIIQMFHLEMFIKADSNLTISYSVNALYSNIINGQGIMPYPQKWSGTVHYIDTLYNVYSYLWNSGHTNEDIDGLNQGVYSVIASDCNGCSTTITATVGLLSGCTDPNACNFDPSAVSDDGSCLNNLGCTDYLACNYDPLANCDDGSCLTLYGCTDITSCNYDSLATL